MHDMYFILDMTLPKMPCCFHNGLTVPDATPNNNPRKNCSLIGWSLVSLSLRKVVRLIYFLSSS